MTQPRAVLVTGSSRGIGAAIAKALAGPEVRLWLAARDAARCEALVAELGARGGEVRAVSLDVTDGDSIAAAAETIGELDGLVNNAGIAESAPLPTRGGEDLEEHYRFHMEVNYHGARRVMEAFLPGMVRRGHGRIVNVASSAALQGYAYVSAYCASKHALLGYSRAAAEELRSKGVGVDVVCPHYVESPMLEASIANLVGKTGMSADDARDFFREQNPGGRIVLPEEVAEVVGRLLSESETGRVIEMDGSPVLDWPNRT